VLYAQGYRFDIAAFSIKKVGAFLSGPIPRVLKSSWTGKSGPGKPVLQFRYPDSEFVPEVLRTIGFHAGYKNWGRKVAVSPSRVVEANAILLPEKADSVLTDGPKILPPCRRLGFARERRKLYWENKSVSGSELVDYSKDGNEVLTRNLQGAYFLSVASRTWPR